MQRKVKSVDQPVHARLTLPGCKNITWRALLLASLAEGVSELTNVNFNADTKALIHALQQAGIAIQVDVKASTCIIAGCNGKLPKKQATIWCNNSKLTTRFMLTLCGASSGVYYFDGGPELRSSNIRNQMQLICRQGAQSIPNDNEKLPATLIGADSFEGDDFIFPHNTPSSTLTAFLILAPFARTPFNFTLANGKHYADMTCVMMAEFGVLVHRIHQGQLMIPVPQRYIANNYAIEPDITLLSFVTAAAAITNGEITLQSFKKSHSKQLAISTLYYLEEMGCVFKDSPEGFTITTGKIKHTEITIKKFSNTFAAILAVAPFADAPTTIHYSSISSRQNHWLATLSNELNKLGIRLDISADKILVHPGYKKGALLNAHDDALMTLMFMAIGMRLPGISMENGVNLESVYHGFNDVWATLQHTREVLLT